MIAMAAGSKSRSGIQSRSDGGAAQRKLIDVFQSFPDSRLRQFHLPGISAEFLPQAHRYGILQMRPPDLENLPELLPFRFERLAKQVHRGQQRFVRGSRGGDVQGRGEHIVARLAAVHVIVGMNRFTD